MNERDKTAQMMQDSSGQHWGTEAHFQRFAALIRANEREACAKVCDDLLAPDIYTDTDKSMWDVTCTDCAAAIRARGTT